MHVTYITRLGSNIKAVAVILTEHLKEEEKHDFPPLPNTAGQHLSWKKNRQSLNSIQACLLILWALTPKQIRKLTQS